MAPRARAVCGHRVGSKADFLYLDRDDVEVYLCGRAKCERDYNGVPEGPEPAEDLTPEGA